MSPDLISAEKARQVIDRACATKTAYPHPGTARAAARRTLTRGQPIRAYRCPFSGPHPHWHTGHVPSLASLQLIAAAIRWHHQHPPEPEAVDVAGRLW